VISIYSIFIVACDTVFLDELRIIITVLTLLLSFLQCM